MSAGPDGHGSATAGGVVSVTSVLRVVGGAASTRFAATREADRQHRAAVGGRVDHQRRRQPVRTARVRRGRPADSAVHRGAEGVGRDRTAGHLHDQPDLAVAGTGGDGDERWLRRRAGRGEQRRQGEQDKQDDEQDGPG